MLFTARLQTKKEVRRQENEPGGRSLRFDFRRNETQGLSRFAFPPFVEPPHSQQLKIAESILSPLAAPLSPFHLAPVSLARNACKAP